MPKRPTPQRGSAVPPVIPTGAALYDRLMTDIEPELVSSVLPTLAKTYRGESPIESRIRAERYTRAFQRYDKALDKYLFALGHTMKKNAATAAASLEQSERAAEKENISELEHVFNS